MDVLFLEGLPIRCNRLLSRQHIVHTSDGRVVGSGLDQLGVALGLGGNLVHHIDEGIDGLLAFVLRGLNHEALMEEEGEVDGGSMVAVVEEALGNVHRGDARALIYEAVEDTFVLAQTLDGEEVVIAQAFLNIISVERGQRSYHLHVLTTETEDVSVGLQHHAVVAEEGADRKTLSPLPR